MANSNVKNASDKCEKRTSTRKATHTTRQARKEAAAKTKAKSGHTHTQERQLALGLREGVVGVCVAVGVVCLKTPRTRARQNKLKF